MFNRIALAVITLSVFATPSSFAARHLSVNGPKAEALFKALTKAGVESRHGVDTAFLKVSRVDCAAGGGIVFLPMHCSLQDESAGKELHSDGELANALENAGVKSTSIVMGELHESRVGASVIECNTLFNGLTMCSIEL